MYVKVKAKEICREEEMYAINLTAKILIDEAGEVQWQNALAVCQMNKEELSPSWSLLVLPKHV